MVRVRRFAGGFGEAPAAIVGSAGDVFGGCQLVCGCTTVCAGPGAQGLGSLSASGPEIGCGELNGEALGWVPYGVVMAGPRVGKGLVEGALVWRSADRRPGSAAIGADGEGVGADEHDAVVDAILADLAVAGAGLPVAEPAPGRIRVGSLVGARVDVLADDVGAVVEGSGRGRRLGGDRLGRGLGDFLGFHHCLRPGR